MARKEHLKQMKDWRRGKKVVCANAELFNKVKQQLEEGGLKLKDYSIADLALTALLRCNATITLQEKN